MVEQCEAKWNQLKTGLVSMWEIVKQLKEGITVTA
jgi:hypothetical protein